jgi:predicted phosphodiesterase
MPLSPGEYIRKIVRWILERPVRILSDRFSSFPDQNDVSSSLTNLYNKIQTEKNSKGLVLDINPALHSIVIFSDHHKGARNGSDDFSNSAENYRTALQYYNDQQFSYINLGDSEELWENTILSVIKYNKAEFEAEKRFVARKAMFKIIGNHDLFWDNDPFAGLYLKKMFDEVIPIYRGIILRVQLEHKKVDIFCTHGHQGDKQSDGNAFSKWFVSWIWGPLQSYLKINTNRPSSNNELKTKHNEFMYHWSSLQNNLILVTGHTHQPVFRSLTHLERLYLRKELAEANGDTDLIQKLEAEIPRRKKEFGYIQQTFRELKPTYFNSGCCCFEDGTITGIEIAGGNIRLVKWSKGQRIIAEEEKLELLTAGGNV